MVSDKVLGLLALGWLVGAVLLMARLIWRGRQLSATLGARHPEFYEAQGRPRPGFLHHARRRQFTRFMVQRAYEDLNDPALSTQFENYRKAERRLLWTLLASLALLTLLILTLLPES